MVFLRNLVRPVAVALLAVVAATSVARADSVNTRERQVRQLAPGVYTIRHADPTDDFPDGNTTVVIGEREVLVVDTCYLPSSAEADIALIRGWTDKPVRWVLNTHWHNDHVGGNQRYRLAWPGADVVAHEETRRMINGRVPSDVRRFIAPDSTFAKQRETLRRTIETGVDAKGASADAAARSTAAASLAKLQRAAREFAAMAVEPPTVTFESSLRIDLGNRVVELKHLGRGNTGGDVVAWLPAERILVAGDLVDHPVPYASPAIPAIGPAPSIASPRSTPSSSCRGTAKCCAARATSRASPRWCVASVSRSPSCSRNGGGFPLEEVQKAIDLSEARRAFAGDDADNREFFDASMASLIRTVHAEVRAR